MISGVDYDFLFVVDLQGAKSMSKALDALKMIDGYTFKKRKYHDAVINELTDNENPNSTLYFSIVDNLLVATYTGELIERAVDSRATQYWKKNKVYQEVSNELSYRKLFKFYFNYKQLNNFSSIYAKDIDEYTIPIANSLLFTALNMNLLENRLSFDGFTAIDSVPSYLSALSDVKPGRMRAYEIISNQAALYFSISFKNYNILFESLINQYEEGNSKDLEDYNKNIKRVEKYFKINMQEDFFGWIGEEIAFIKLQPGKRARVEDVVVAIHAKEIEDAKNGLTHITKQIRRKSPLRFDIINYKNFAINYLEMKGRE